MRHETRELWARRLDEWEKSGLTAVEFSKRMGLNVRTLRFWRWQLLRPNRGTSHRPSKKGKESSRPRFVEIPREEIETVSRGPGELDLIELIVRGGVRIRVPLNFDADCLRRVVAALEEL